MALDKVKYWTDLANYDIDTADLMFSGGRWLYVGFMCHQAIEKALKAHWCAVRDDFCKQLLEETKALKSWIESKH